MKHGKRSNFSNHSLSKSDSVSSFLNNPGDRLDARVTESGRKVLTAEKNYGEEKYSMTEYPNGTTVETRTKRKK